MPEPRATRRGLLGLAAAASLGGCGFRPMYAPEGRSATPDYEERVTRELAAVQVALQGERTGQLFRRALQEKLNPRGTGVAARYEIRTGLTIAADPLGFRRDGTLSRVRYNGAAPWTLVVLGTPPVALTAGRARSFESYDVLDNQFFASDFAQEEAIRRLIEILSDDIVTRLALYFRSQPAG
ncbi:LPS assembly lipoprotein LptE [Humitalea sp. 24SJ18S-53]|uniref:LPS assembly lipoprotein LptE n=1 Tax=Humitalea sp. 24SJ18S-53 TaxID=3422307 RepID=UPI003D6642E6